MAILLNCKVQYFLRYFQNAYVTSCDFCRHRHWLLIGQKCIWICLQERKSLLCQKGLFFLKVLYCGIKLAWTNPNIDCDKIFFINLRNKLLHWKLIWSNWAVVQTDIGQMSLSQLASLFVCPDCVIAETTDQTRNIVILQFWYDMFWYYIWKPRQLWPEL